MKKLVIILDGVLDDVQPTPLTLAHTPNLDKLSQCGSAFLVKTIPDGCPIGSDIGNLTLLGHGNHKLSMGRAGLEYAGLGHTLKPGQGVYRLNLISFEPQCKHLLSANAGGVTDEENREVLDILGQVFNHPSESVISLGGHVYLLVTNQDYGSWPSLNGRLGKDSTAIIEADPRLNRAIRQFEKSMSYHTINMQRRKKNQPTIDGFWIWGKASGHENLKESTSRVMVVSGTPIVKGLGAYMGYDTMNHPGLTGTLETNYELKMHKALEALKTHNLVFCHVEAPDLAGHLRDPHLKKEVIETIDEKMLGQVYDKLKDSHQPVEVYILADHGTSSLSGDHIIDMVPCLYGVAPWRFTGNDQRYTEDLAKGAPVLDGKQWRERLLL